MAAITLFGTDMNKSYNGLSIAKTNCIRTYPAQLNETTVYFVKQIQMNKTPFQSLKMYPIGI